jgi:hypothetical protein
MGIRHCCASSFSYSLGTHIRHDNESAMASEQEAKSDDSEGSKWGCLALPRTRNFGPREETNCHVRRRVSCLAFRVFSKANGLGRES